MLALTTKLPQFNQFLLDNLGIERNDFTVEEARAAAKHGGDGWKDCCTQWRLSCAIPPDDSIFAKLRLTLLALKKITVDAPAPDTWRPMHMCYLRESQVTLGLFSASHNWNVYLECVRCVPLR